MRTECACSLGTNRIAVPGVVVLLVSVFMPFVPRVAVLDLDILSKLIPQRPRCQFGTGGEDLMEQLFLPLSKAEDDKPAHFHLSKCRSSSVLRYLGCDPLHLLGPGPLTKHRHNKMLNLTLYDLVGGSIRIKIPISWMLTIVPT